MRNKFSLIVFDWDGTLIDSINWIAHCIQYAAEQCGFPIPEKQTAKNIIGLSIENAFETLFPGVQVGLRNQLIEHYQTVYKSQEMTREHFFDGVYDMLLALKVSGYQLAVATGKTRKGLAHALRSTRTEQLFDITRCADETASKPAPQMLLEILNFCRVSSDEALMVGDTVFDLQMANSANMCSVAVTCGAHPEQLLKQHNPLRCLTQPVELLNMLI
jgi:phosphoglycolate phosphatase